MNQVLWSAISRFVLFLLFGLPIGLATPTPTLLPTPLPHPAHVLLVIEENHAYGDVIGSPAAPYINALATQGATFTNSHAITHPSEPNYLALFSGSTQGVASDACPVKFSGPNLATELLTAKDTFAGFSENLPQTGYTGCSDTNHLYARKHNPWTDFTNLPASLNMPWTAFPQDYSQLPTLSIVVPNLQNDMHDGSIQQGDTWLKSNLDAYVQWAKTHNSLLVVTWDEDDGSAANQIPTLFVGPMIKPGQYNENINHYSVLNTLETLYSLPHANNSSTAHTITDVWQ